MTRTVGTAPIPHLLQEMGVRHRLQDALLAACMPIMLSVYCWASEAAPAQGRIMVLLDDGAEPMPACHSGGAFPWNRAARGTLVEHSFALQAGQVAEVHLAVRDYKPGTRRATVLLRGRQGEAETRSEAPPAGEECMALVPLEPGAHGLVLGSVRLRFVPSAYVSGD